MTESEEYDIFLNKHTDKIYVSKSIDVTQILPNEGGGIIERKRPIRYISKVSESEQQEFVKLKDEIILRSTSKARQEIIAKFYEDSRNILTLQIQKYSVNTGIPHKTYFTFVGEEIWKLYFFIRNIPLLPIKGKEKQQFQVNYIDNIILSKNNILKFIYEQPEIIPELIEELQKYNIKHNDIKNLAYRKGQLEIFENMLYDDVYFEKQKRFLGINKDELVWQNFFERNTWILGYGLNYIFNTELEGKKLEQVIKGYDFNSSGKRVDLLMKTKGLISTLYFGEIKTHKTCLLKNVTEPYRRECWSVSDELYWRNSIIRTKIKSKPSNIICLKSVI